MLLTLLRGLRQVTPGIVWRGAPWSAIQVGSCPSAKFRHVLGQLCVPPLGRHTIVAQSVCYVDVRVVWRVSNVVSGIRVDTVSDEQHNVAGLGLYEMERSLSV